MPAPRGKDRNPSGLGRAIINKKVKEARYAHENGLYTTDVDNTSRLQSITQERDLDEFLNTATLAGTQFTAERRNVKIISAPAGSQHNPYLLSEEEEKRTLQKHHENKQRLRVPRRPPWTKSMSTVQLDRQEKDAFLEWRRGIAQLSEQDNFLLTPFERNIEVWRQLWRVIERSHLVVQIVDARNPLRFRCEDLESYVKDVEGAEGEKGTGKNKRKNLLLINKSDLLTAQQRRQWADYLDARGVQYAFYSAANAAALQQVHRDQQALLHYPLAQQEVASAPAKPEESPTSEHLESPVVSESGSEIQDSDEWEDDSDESFSDDNSITLDDETEDTQDPRAHVLSVMELEELFLRVAPDLHMFADSAGNSPTKLVVGLVGYPNVGKSSTINSLIGEKKVSVSSTPGKTKHFQTIQLSSSITLCDCPGLVFPQFATTRADLVCDGVLPIDQLREHTGPVALITQRIPRDVLEAIYGLTIRLHDEGGTGDITAENFLIAYAVARGFTRSGQGNPDEARAARYILKDYVNAKLLFCHPPPGIGDNEFNEKTRAIYLKRAAGKKRAPVTRVGKGADTFILPGAATSSESGTAPNVISSSGQKSDNLDRDFFSPTSGLSSRPFVQGSAQNGQSFTRTRLYPHQNTVLDDGSTLGGRKARIAAVLASAGGEIVAGKKHHKKMKRVKQRSGRGYD